MALPTPPPSTPSSSNSTSARRLCLQNSSDEGTDLAIFPGSRTLSYTGERFRVGIPALQLLPLMHTPVLPPSLVATTIAQMRPRIERILQDRAIDHDDMSVLYRTVPNEPQSEEDITLLIDAIWTHDDDAQSWFFAAQDIRDLFIAHPYTQPVKVELLSWQLEARRIVDIVEPNYPLVPAWTAFVNRRVHSIIDEWPKLRDGWKCIDVLRIRFAQDDRIGAVTISITVEWGLNRRDWQIAERQIRDFLDQHDFPDVQIEFERGDVDPSVFPLQTPNRDAEGPHEYIKEDYAIKASLGADFSPEEYFMCQGQRTNGFSATIGGYLELRINNGPWKKYAVTNYHCIRKGVPGYSLVENPTTKRIEAAKAPRGSMLRRLDLNGCGPGYKNRQDIAPFESPSRRKHNFSLQYHDTQIETLERMLRKNPSDQSPQKYITEHREAKARKMAFFDNGNHHLGKSFLCSGFSARTPENGQIDIALLEVEPNRMGDNMIPSASAWKHSEPPLPNICETLLQGIESCKDMGNLDRVYKIGAMTGATTGRFNSIKSDVKMSWTKEYNLPFTTEYCFVSNNFTSPRPFLRHGDSGSWLFTGMGRWVGSTVGGPAKFNVVDQAVAYVMDAQAVLDWLNDLGSLSGGKNTYEARLATN